MSWEGLTTENHLGSAYTETKKMTIPEIKEMYKLELKLQEDRERSAKEMPFGSGLGIRAQMEQANVVLYEPMTIDSMTKAIEDLIKSVGSEERREFKLHTGEGGMREFDRTTKSVTREEWTVEQWAEQLEKEMTL